MIQAIVDSFHIVMPFLIYLPDGSMMIECPPYSEWYDTFDRGAFCRAI